MKPAVKREWIKALRSGKYRQTRGVLRNSHKKAFCCLGVLCDVYDKKLKQSRWKKDLSGDWKYLGRGGVLPRQIVRWAGLKLSDPTYTKGGRHMRTLTNANDIQKLGFRAIATIIEKHL